MTIRVERVRRGPAPHGGAPDGPALPLSLILVVLRFRGSAKAPQEG
jgi:hypothetical protein